MALLAPICLGYACHPENSRRCCAGLTGQSSPRLCRPAELGSPNFQNGVLASAGRPRRAQACWLGRSSLRSRQIVESTPSGKGKMGRGGKTPSVERRRFGHRAHPNRFRDPGRSLGFLIQPADQNGISLLPHTQLSWESPRGLGSQPIEQ